MFVGIDIDAGCGQLKADLLKKQKAMIEGQQQQQQLLLEHVSLDNMPTN